MTRYTNSESDAWDAELLFAPVNRHPPDFTSPSLKEEPIMPRNSQSGAAPALADDAGDVIDVSSPLETDQPGSRPAPVAKPAAAPVKLTSADVAVAMIRERADNDQRDATAQLNAAREYYFVLLCRSEQPLPNDARDLVYVMRDLSISPDQVQADRALVAEIPKLTQLHSEIPDAIAKVSPLRVEHHTFDRRMEEARSKLMRAISEQDHRLTLGQNAAFRLAKLSKQRPEFFEASDKPNEPPRLRACNLLATGAASPVV